MPKLYIFYGNDEISINNRIIEITDSDLNSNTSKLDRHEVFKSEDLETLYNNYSNKFLFSQNSILEIFTNLKGLDVFEKDLVNFINFVKDICSYEKVFLIINLEKSDSNTKSKMNNSSFLKNFKDSAKIEEYFKLAPWQLNEMKSKTVQIANALDIKFEDESLSLFVDCIKNSFDSLQQELYKIKIYLLPDKLITVKIIEDLYCFSNNIDDYYNMILSSSFKSLSLVTKSLQNSQNSLYLLAILQNKFRQALKIKQCMAENLNSYQISKLLGITSYVVEREIQKLKNVSINHLKNVLVCLSNVEFKVKSGLINDANVLDLISIGVSIG